MSRKSQHILEPIFYLHINENALLLAWQGQYSHIKKQTVCVGPLNVTGHEVILELIKAHDPGGQRSVACVSSRIHSHPSNGRAIKGRIYEPYHDLDD